MKKQRILSLLLALAMVFSLLPASAMAVKVEDFTDVSKDDWFYKYVDFVADEEYFVGTSKTTFSPEMSMTRAMFVVVLAAVEGVKVDNNVSPFADVPANTWYSGAVAWAAEKGVVAGVGGNKFAPDTAISREQMAVMMDAYVDWHSKKTGETHKEKSKVESFKDDAKISSWAEEGVENCRNWGLIAGAPDGNFYPQNTATRAEVATVIYNLAWLVYGGGGGGGIGHTHNWVLKHDADYHWYECTCTSEQKDKALHTWDAGVVTTEPAIGVEGVKTFTCTVCGCTKTETIPALDAPVDHIYNALAKAAAAIQQDIADNFEGNTIPDSATAGGSKTYVTVTGMTLGAPNTLGVTDPHAIIVEAEADIDSNTLCAIAEYAVSNAIELTGAAVSKIPTKAEAKEMVKETVSVLESKLGVDLKLSKESIAEIAEIVYNTAKDKAAAGRNYGVAYVKSLRENFIGDEGGYVTGDVTISVGGNTVVLDVEENTVAVADTTKTKAVATIAAGIAKELYDCLQACTTYTDLNKIVLETTVDIDFSGEYSEGTATAYKEDTDQFPYCYPVTFKLSMVDCETSVGDNIQYKYENGHFINIKVTDAAKAEYEKLVELAIDEVMSSEAVKAQIEKLMNNAGMSEDKMSDAAMDAVGNDLVDALSSMGMTNANTEVTKAIESWIDTNVTEDLGNSPMLDLIMTGSSTGNEDLYDLVTLIADETAAYMFEVGMYAPNSYPAYATTPEIVATQVTTLAGRPELGSNVSDAVKTLEDLKLDTFFYAAITDKLHTNPTDGKLYELNESGLNEQETAYVEQPDAAGVTPTDSMKVAVDSMVYDMAVDTVKANTSDSQQDILKKLNALRSLDTAKELQLAELSPILTGSAAQKIMAKYENTVVERITGLIRYIPDEASIILPNGVEVKESTLSKVRDAETFGEACSATAALLKNFAGLSLSSFAESQDITVKYDGQNKDIAITVGLKIEIA